MSSQTTTTPTPAPPPGKSFNVKFIVIGLLALGALVGGVAALNHAMWLRRDRQTIAWAEQAMKDGRYEDAAAQFDRAVARHPADAELSLKSGDAYYALSASKPEALQKARVAWEAAARLMPNDLPAFHRLLRFQADLVEVHPTPAGFRALGEVAQRVASIAPADKEAATARTIAVLGPWFSQAGGGTAADAGAHDALIASLGDSLRQDEVDPRAIVYYALAVSRRAVELRRAGQSAAAQQVLDRAKQRIANDAADHDPQAVYRAAEGMTILAEACQRLDEISDVPAPAAPVAVPPVAATTQPATTQPAVALAPRPMWPTWDEIDYRVKWDESGATPPEAGPGSPTTRPAAPAAADCLMQARSLAGRAAASVAASDPHFVGIRLLEAHLVQATGAPDAAERIRRETLAARPGSLRAQLALAESVGGAHPNEAEAILEQPEKPDDAGPGPIALARRELLISASLHKARLYLDAATNAADDPVARQANVQKANDACEKLAAMLVSDAASLKLTGRLRMFQGRYADAVRLFDRALMTPGSRGDLDLLAYRGAALVALHEPQVALQSLRAALVADPSRSADRLLLAQTLLDEGRLTEAAEQVERVGGQLGDDPRALALRVRFLAATDACTGDDSTARQLREAYAKLPETDLKQRLAKAELALSVGESADAVRLLRKERSAGSSSIVVAADLARALIASGKGDDATVALAEALRQHAGEPTLLAVQKSIDGPASPEAYEATLNDSNAKDFLKAVHTCREALEARDLPKAREQLDTIAQLRADDPLLFDLRFRYDLASEQWADAGVCVDRLARANFDRAEGLTYAFRLDAARGHFIAAANVARQLTLRYGRLAEGWLDLGRAMQGLGRPDRAVDNFHQAITLDPKNLDAIKALAECLTSAGRGAEADKWIAQGRQLAPADSDLRELEFERQLALGDPRRLIDARKATLQNEPQRPDNVIALARVYLRIERLEALSNPPEAKQRLKDATDVLDAAVQKWPDDKDCSFWDAHAWAIAGDVAGGKQKLRRLCDRLAWSHRPEAEQLLAEYCLIWGDPQSAQVALRDAIARGASGAATARQRADILMHQGAWRTALDVLQPYPADLLARQQRITIVVATGNADLAEKELDAALAADPANPRLMTLLGMLYAARRDDVRAKNWLDRAFAGGDEELAGRARGELGLRERAADLEHITHDLAVASEANPADSGAALLLGEACLRSRDAARAQRVLRAALAIAPSNSDVRRSVIAMARDAATPDWARLDALVEAGRQLAPSDNQWDMIEARTWLARQSAGKAAALMRHAVNLARTATEAADPIVKVQFNARYAALMPEEYWMLLLAGANDAALAEADDAIGRYGSRDMLSAWAHYARGAVNRRVGREAEARDEYNTALSIAQAAAGYFAAANVIETISTESGPDEAIRRINGYVDAVDAGRADGVHDARFDLLRIDLYRRNNELHAAAAEVDKLMPRIATLPAPIQDELLRMAVVIYSQDTPAPQYDKASAACATLLKRLPDDIWALNNMAAFSLAQPGATDSVKALDYAQHAYKAAGRGGAAVDPQVADTYGWALARAGRPREALDMLKGVAGQLSIPDVQYHMAEAYLAVGDAQSAWSHLAAALRLIDRDARQGARVDPLLRRGIADACWRVLRDDAAQMLKPSRGGASNADLAAPSNAAESRNATVN